MGAIIDHYKHESIPELSKRIRQEKINQLQVLIDKEVDLLEADWGLKDSPYDSILRRRITDRIWELKEKMEFLQYGKTNV